ncbi:MAG: hypothetical protein PGN09_04085 [Sphingomonas fennica]
MSLAVRGFDEGGGMGVIDKRELGPERLPAAEQAAAMYRAAGEAAIDEARRRFHTVCLCNDIARTSYWMQVLAELSGLGATPRGARRPAELP